MPELPEVETIKRGLEKKIVGLKIREIEILNPKTFTGDPKLIIGKTVTKVWRRAKVLGIELMGESVLLFHLKMSGQLILVGGKDKFVGGHPTQDMAGLMPVKSTRVIFSFSNNSKLYFNDQRKFGWIKVMDKGQLTMDKLLSKLGPEPLEKAFIWEILKSQLLRHKTLPIKVALLDQQTISGVGNIYASEACFNAKLDPRKRVSNLTDSEYKSLYIGLIKALKDGIKYGGSSRTNYVNTDGEKGLFLDYAFVYKRAGQPCKVCQTPILQIKQSGRSTFFCPTCQS